MTIVQYDLCRFEMEGLWGRRFIFTIPKGVLYGGEEFGSDTRPGCVSFWISDDRWHDWYCQLYKDQVDSIIRILDWALGSESFPSDARPVVLESPLWGRKFMIRFFRPGFVSFYIISRNGSQMYVHVALERIPAIVDALSGMVG